MNLRLLFPVLTLVALPAAAQWTNLLADKTLSGWESIGDGSWTLRSDGILIGQKNISEKGANQGWFYTRKVYDQFDLEFDWWLRLGGNSGVSLRDTSRAKWAITANWDADKTPSTSATKSSSATVTRTSTSRAAYTISTRPPTSSPRPTIGTT